MDRGCQFFVSFTGGFEYKYTYQNQFQDMFPDTDFGSQLTLKRYPDADHLFTILEHRQRYIDDLVQWCQAQFGQKTASFLEPIVAPSSDIKNKIAIMNGSNSISYGELSKQVLQGVALLRDHGVKPGDRVGIHLPRSTEQIIAVLSAVAAGATYVPFDMSYPEKRLNFMIEDSQCKVLFSEQKHQGVDTISPSLIKECHPSRQLHDHSDNDGFYMIYTSGSTGNPKGIVMPFAR